MSDLKLFRLPQGHATEPLGSPVALKKSLQHTIERNMQRFFGITSLHSEYSTGTNPGGRTDSLEIDENSSPAISGHNRAVNANLRRYYD